MQLDTNIWANLLRQPKSVADYDQEAQVGQLNALKLQDAQQNMLMNRQKADEYTRSVRDAQQLRETVGAAGGDPAAVLKALYGSGRLPEAQAYQKHLDDSAKTKAGAAKDWSDTHVKALSEWRDLIGSSGDPQMTAAMVARMHADPRLQGTAITQVPLDQVLGRMSSMAATPEGFNQWRQEFALGAQKFIEQNKPTTTTMDLGGTKQIMQTPGLGGAPTVAYSAPKTETPESLARSRDAAAGRAQSAAQHGARLAFDKEKEAKKPSGGGNITEGERNAGGYAARMVDATKLLDQFESKGRSTYKTDALGGVPLVGRALQTSAMSAEQQQYRQAQEDWVRAKLRKESGAAIGIDEMAKEISTYFPEPGDRKENVAQKKQAREVANKAMLQSAGRGAPKVESAPSPGTVLKFDAQGNPVP